MSTKTDRMKELVKLLREAARAYYTEDREVMSNLEYDRLYEELEALEKETGTVFAGSPTVTVGYEVQDELPKERHESPMLSLDKTKNVEELKEFLGSQKALMSWKLDGLTIVLTYRNGKLLKAVTRGNGEVGEVITANAKVFQNVPLTIPFEGELILRGEAVISYSDFQKINSEIEEADARYKNPRNLCSGSVRQLNSEITARRNVRFYAFALVRAAGEDFENSRERQFEWLLSQGFDVVEYHMVTAENVEEKVQYFAEKISEFDIPSDGLVLVLNDISYGQSLGVTSKFPRDSIAFKWADEQKATHLLEIEWSASRTGLINPVAIFEPVELEGTTVSRASVHNISILKALELGIGDEITVYKANMIIPQIAENLTRSKDLPIPDICPVCGGHTEIKDVNDVQSLYCINPECQAKRIKSFTLAVSRDALNIDGISEATLEKFVDRGFVREFADLFRLSGYREEIIAMEGFKEKSFQNMIDSADRARKTTLPRVIYSLGIPGIGLANAKMLCREFGNDPDRLKNAGEEELDLIDGIGPVLARSFVEYFRSEQHREEFENLLNELEIEQEAVETAQNLSGMNFVITGSVTHFENRAQVKEAIEKRGGKVTGSVTSKTNYLVNNDVSSASSKNKKARKLNIPILSEEELIEQFLS